MKKVYLILLSFILAEHQVVFSQTTFNYTGAVQTYSVPDCTDSINIIAWGAGGAGGGADSHDNMAGGAGGNGGGGAYATSTVKVHGGDILKIYVGGGGTGGWGCVGNTGGGTGGFGYGNGGNGGNVGPPECSGGGGAGGGSSAVYDNTASALLLAAAGGGGGGGGGGVIYGLGGPAGGGGQNGTGTSAPGSTGGITGANTTAAGATGIVPPDNGGGGGGGGGGATFGGTGGGAPSSDDAGAGGGGGGNNLGATVMNGNGQTPGNSADPNLCVGCAAGSAGEVLYHNDTALSGGNGIVIITPILTTITLSATQLSPNCTGDATVTPTGGVSPYTYSWSPTGGTNASASGLSAGTYTITTTDAGGCSATTKITISISPLKVKTAITAPCDSAANGIATVTPISGSGPYTYLWSNGNTTQKDTALSPGNYTCIVTDSAGCKSTLSIKIPSSPSYSCCYDTTIIQGDTARLTSQSGTKYSWMPNTNLNCDTCKNVIATPTVTTTYTETFTTSNGCVYSQVFTVIVVEQSCLNFKVPNVFTPNGDGINETFEIDTKGLTNWSVEIYDRWGKEMFKTTNLSVFWTGQAEDGNKAPDGVYYYIVNATCQSTSYKKDGYIQLIR